MTSGLWQHFACIIAAAVACGAQAQQQVQSATQPGYIAPAPLPSARPSPDECKRRWAAYERSQACFAPFHTVTGIKPEAFTVCGKQLPEPSAECRPRTNP
jgi:hypothetical protein